MDVNLSEMVILVTGAAQGIGAAIANEVSASGGVLVVSDVNEPRLAEVAEKLEATQIVADLAQLNAPSDILDQVLRDHGRIDGLVNAAGLTTRSSMVDGSPEVWENLFAVNARAPFFLMQAAIKSMLAQSTPSSIVNILSMNAHCGEPDLAIYSGTKGALATLTKNAANAHLADDIRVNGINLGWVATEAEQDIQSKVLGRGPGWLAEEEAKMPLGHLVEAEDCARLATFLLSEASAPMTGTILDLEQRVAGAA